MDAAALLRELESRGSAQTRKTYGRHGIRGSMFGVSYKDLGILTRRLKTNHPLALELWKTENHDARILATMIADPALKSGELNRWMSDVENHVVADAVAGVIAHSRHGQSKADKWRNAKGEILSYVGWSITARLATNDSELDDDYFKPLVELIEKRIHSAANWTRCGMNGALIAIGVRSFALRKLVLAAAKRIGKVEVDYGDTACKTPDAAAYIAKTVAHRKKRAARKKK
jgi:3-methyladenine DNA glycosylase AlkD